MIRAQTHLDPGDLDLSAAVRNAKASVDRSVVGQPGEHVARPRALDVELGEVARHVGDRHVGLESLGAVRSQSSACPCAVSDDHDEEVGSRRAW